MELGQNQLQIFSGLMVILGAAFVALVCDLLKGNNEQLRELALELKVRREEEHKRFQILAPRMIAAAIAGAPAVEKRAEPTEGNPIRSKDAVKHPVSGDAAAAIQRGVQLAASLRPQSAPAGRSYDWAKLLSVRRAPPPSRKESRKAAAPASNTEASLPAGFQDGFVLSRLVEARQPISGLVVSIGASSKQGVPGGVRELIQSLVVSLIGPNDFAAQPGPDEFLLIYPGERGAQAQRKLSQIAEQLWDFQLSSMSALSIQFSWGGVEVRGESIEEAVASATERMQETRRGRKILTMDDRPAADAPLRQAV